ncbi:MAG: NAD(P)-binding protein [Ilumatobacteraceae bacterium]
MSAPFDVAVLGAGPAGLAAAHAATRRGRRVVVIDRAPTVGGLAASFEIDGHRVDYGSHRLHRSTPPHLLATLKELLGDELQLRLRNGRIRLDRRWLAFPLQPLDLVRNAPLTLTAGALVDTAVAPLRTRREVPDTFSAQVRRGLGGTIARRFYEPYAEKLWGTDPNELSGELFRRRVSVGTGAGLVRRVLGGRDDAKRSFWYPRRGFGRISEALADAAVTAGARLQLGAEVHDIGEVLELAPRVICTLPASTAVSLYGDRAPANVVTASQSLTYRGAAIVYLLLDSSRYSAFDAHYLPDPAVPVARVSEPKNYRDDVAAPRATTVLCAEVPTAVDGPLWNASDADLAVVVADALCRSGMPRLGHVARVRVKRVPHVYPIYRVGFERSLDAVEEWASSRDELLLVGRQALFAHDNTHHAMAMGDAAGSVINDDGGFDRAAWRVARDGFRNHVVED